MQPLTVGKAGVAELLGVSLKTVQRLAAAGRLPAPIRLSSKLVLWRVKDIEKRVAEGLAVK